MVELLLSAEAFHEEFFVINIYIVRSPSGAVTYISRCVLRRWSWKFYKPSIFLSNSGMNPNTKLFSFLSWDEPETISFTIFEILIHHPTLIFSTSPYSLFSRFGMNPATNVFGLGRDEPVIHLGSDTYFFKILGWTQKLKNGDKVHGD